MYAKKFLALFLSAALMVSMLAGCNKQPDDDEGDGSSSSSQGTSQNGGSGNSGSQGGGSSSGGNSGSQGGGSSSGGETEQPDEGEGESGDEVPAPANILHLEQINSTVKKTDERINVIDSDELNYALQQVSWLIADDYTDKEITSTFLLYQIGKYLEHGYDYLVIASAPTNQELEDGIGSFYDKDLELHTLEEVIAQDVLGLEDYIKNRTYAASAAKITTSDGVSGYIFAIELV